MESELIQILTAKGFSKEPMGGNIEAMVRVREGATDVVTATDGGLPDSDNWLFVTYEGNWLNNPEAKEMDCIDSESSPMHLLEVVDL